VSLKLYLLLPVHNRRAITEKFIDCLAAQSYTNYHLILIDDGSTDGTSDMVRARIGNLTVLRGAGDWWWAGSLQQGIDWLKRNAANDDIVLFINDDVTFDTDFLSKGVQLLDQLGGMLLPQVVNDKTGSIVETGVEADLKKLTFKTATSAERINCLPTRGLFMRMETMQMNGNFYPKLLPHYLSDYEYTIRAHRKGIKLVTMPELTIGIDENATGYRKFDDLTIPEFFNRYFSIKSAHNPIYWTMFILLAVPKVYIPWSLIKVWLSALKSILHQVRSSFKGI
jgi:GT2 family glycosyltransferase